MDYIGIDLHKEHTQICVVDAEGAVLLEVRIKTGESTFVKFFGGLAPAKILLEASGMSEWAARVLEGCGHEVIVGDTNYGLMYSARNPKVKTDARDARALAESCRLGLHRAAYRASDEEIPMRRVITCRGAPVEFRTKLATTLRAAARHEGIKIPTGSPEKIAQRMRKAGIKEEFFEQVESLLAAIDAVTEQIDKADKRILELVKSRSLLRRHRRTGSLPERPPGPVLSQAGAKRVQLRRAHAARADHEGRQPLPTSLARPSGASNPPLPFRVGERTMELGK